MARRLLIKLLLLTIFLLALASFMSYQILGTVPFFNKDNAAHISDSIQQSLRNKRNHIHTKIKEKKTGYSHKQSYQWTSPEGQKVIGNFPPANARNIKKIGTAP